MKRMLLVVVCLVLGLALAPQAQAATLYVDINNPACSDINGNPYCHIQPAINAASSGDTIQVAGGTYAENLTIAKSITILGAGTAAKTTVIDGGRKATAITITNAASTVNLSRVTIQHGSAVYGNGGGIINPGILTVNYSLLFDDVAVGGDGGAIYNTGTVTLVNSQITGGGATYDGGGIANSGTLILKQSAVQFTSSCGPGGVCNGGGGIYSAQGQVSLEQSLIGSNNADCGDGAGIYVFSGTLTIDRSTISNNTTYGCFSSRIRGDNRGRPAPRTVSPRDVGGEGGGIYMQNGTLNVNQSTVSGNVVAFGAGGIAAYGQSTLITDSTISANSAGQVGGGISSNGNLFINNSTISGNSAGLGGGLDSTRSATLQNTIVADSPYGGNCSGGLTSNGYNLSSDGTCNFYSTGDLHNTDPMLGPLQNNGGPTQTQALLPGSPAIDAGNPGPNNGQRRHCLATDQRGNIRTDRCDIGAYEYP